jgi:hypothetical protein
MFMECRGDKGTDVKRDSADSRCKNSTLKNTCIVVLTDEKTTISNI